jgi:hypothetical protein
MIVLISSFSASKRLTLSSYSTRISRKSVACFVFSSASSISNSSMRSANFPESFFLSFFLSLDFFFFFFSLLLLLLFLRPRYSSSFCFKSSICCLRSTIKDPSGLLARAAFRSKIICSSFVLSLLASLSYFFPVTTSCCISIMRLVVSSSFCLSETSSRSRVSLSYWSLFS